jgi:hypothetical protein
LDLTRNYLNIVRVFRTIIFLALTPQDIFESVPKLLHQPINLRHNVRQQGRHQGSHPHHEREARGKGEVRDWRSSGPYRRSHWYEILFSFQTLKISNTSVGKALNTGLRPIGAPLEKITGPLGNAVGGTTRGALGPLLGEKEEKMEVLGGENKDSYESKPEKIAGKEQTGQNPLGLDQTGRWGFREE